MYNNAYPWQILTKNTNMELNFRLSLKIDKNKLLNESKLIIQKFAPKKHFGPYHSGGWNSISLISAYGEVYQSEKITGNYEKTEALKIAPYLNDLIDSFNCEKKRVRIMELKPGEDIFWHSDADETLDAGNCRLHIPIFVNQETYSQLSHVNYFWQPGELWYGDFSFPHRVSNRGKKSRYHLVLDLVKNDFVEKMLPESFYLQKELRSKIRVYAYKLYNWTYRRPLKLINKIK